MNKITIDQINYIENFSKKYTPKELKLGTRLKNEINKKRKDITPEIVKEYLRLFNSKELDSKKQELLGKSPIQSTPTTTINTGTIQHVPRVELQPIKESIRSSVEGESGFGSSYEKSMRESYRTHRISFQDSARLTGSDSDATRNLRAIESARASERVDTGEGLPQSTSRRSLRRASSIVALFPEKGSKIASDTKQKARGESARVRGSVRDSVAPPEDATFPAFIEEEFPRDNSGAPILSHARPPVRDESSSENDPPLPPFTEDFLQESSQEEDNPPYPVELDLDDQERDIYNPSDDNSLDPKIARHYVRIQEILRENRVPADTEMNVMTLSDLQKAISERKMDNNIYKSRLLLAKIMNEIPENTEIPDQHREKFIDDSIPFVQGYNEWIQSRKKIAQEKADEAFILQRTPSIPIPELPLSEGWIERKDDQGVTYYANDSTGERQWTRPVISSMRATEAMPDASRYEKDIQWVYITKDGQIYMYFINGGNYYIFYIKDDTAINLNNNYETFDMDPGKFPNTYTRLREIMHKSWSDHISEATPEMVDELGLSQPQPPLYIANDDMTPTSVYHSELPLPPDWTEHKDKRGMTYYANASMDMYQRQRPGIRSTRAAESVRFSDSGREVSGDSAADQYKEERARRIAELSELIASEKAKATEAAPALRASVAPLLPPKPAARFGSTPSTLASNPPPPLASTAQLPTGPIQYIWLFDPEGRNYTSVTIQPNDTRTKFNIIIGSFTINQKIAPFFKILNAQQKFGLELIQSKTSPLDHTLTIPPINPDQYSDFLDDILSQELPWNIKTNKGLIKLPGFWFRTYNQSIAMMGITDNFNFIARELDKLETKCESLKSLKKTQHEYSGKKGLSRTFTRNPEGSIESANQGIQKNMNRVNEAEKHIYGFLTTYAKDLQQKYHEKCRQKLYEIRQKILSFCDDSVIPPSLMAVEVAAIEYDLSREQIISLMDQLVDEISKENQFIESSFQKFVEIPKNSEVELTALSREMISHINSLQTKINDFIDRKYYSGFLPDRNGNFSLKIKFIVMYGIIRLRVLREDLSQRYGKYFPENVFVKQHNPPQNILLELELAETVPTQPAEVLSPAAQAPPEQSVASGALSTNDQKLNDLYDEFIISVKIATGILKGIELSIDNHLGVKVYNRNELIKVLIENFNKANEFIMKSAKIMNTHFTLDVRLQQMVAVLQEVNRYYINTDTKYQAKLKDDSGAHPSAPSDLLLLQTQPVEQSATAALPVGSAVEPGPHLMSRGEGVRQLSGTPMPLSSQVAAPIVADEATRRMAASSSIASPQTSESAQPSKIFTDEDTDTIERLYGQLRDILKGIEQNLKSNMLQGLSNLLQNARIISQQIYDGVIVKYKHDDIIYTNLMEEYNEEKRRYDNYVTEYNKKIAAAAWAALATRKSPLAVIHEEESSGSSHRQGAANLTDMFLSAPQQPSSKPVNPSNIKEMIDGSIDLIGVMFSQIITYLREKNVKELNELLMRVPGVLEQLYGQLVIYGNHYDSGAYYDIAHKFFLHFDNLYNDIKGHKFLFTDKFLYLQKKAREIQPKQGAAAEAAGASASQVEVHSVPSSPVASRRQSRSSSRVSLEKAKPVASAPSPPSFEESQLPPVASNLDGSWLKAFSPAPAEAFGSNISSGPGFDALSRSSAAAQQKARAPDQILHRSRSSQILPQPESAEELTRQFKVYVSNIIHYSSILKGLLKNTSVAESEKSEIKTKHEQLLQSSTQNAIVIQRKLAQLGIQVQIPKSEFFPPAPPPAAAVVQSSGIVGDQGSHAPPPSPYRTQNQGAAAAAEQRARAGSPTRLSISSPSAAAARARNISPTFPPRDNSKIITQLIERYQKLMTKKGDLQLLLRRYNSNLDQSPSQQTIQDIKKDMAAVSLDLVGVEKQLKSLGVSMGYGAVGGGGSHRSSHLAKHKHKNKTKHKHNYNHKARPNRKNKKTIKKYRGMSRMPVMPRMQKQNVAVYRKHKKTTRKYKATRHAKMNKNKPKNSNKKSRKFRR